MNIPNWGLLEAPINVADNTIWDVQPTSNQEMKIMDSTITNCGR